ncbi:MAG: hypothetical protein ACN4GT_07965 [Gammaproteobacteria bacterium]
MKLKDFYGRFGERLLGTSAPDLYELQRELQHLPGFPHGRPGPGGGAEATPEAVTLILVATLAGGPRRRTQQTTPATLDLPTHADHSTPEPAACGLTSQTRFGDAMRAILRDTEIAARVRQVIVCRDWGEAAIAFEIDNRIHESRFMDTEGRRRSEAAESRGTLFGLARIGGAALLEITRELQSPRD